MSGQQGGGGGGAQEEGAYTLLWLVAGFFVACGLIWHFFGTELRIFFIALKKYEAMAVSVFIDNPNMQIARQALDKVTENTLSWHVASTLSTFIGQYIMYPISFMLLVLAVIIFRSSANMRYTKTYNMDMLVHQEKENYPQIAAVADLDLIAEEINTGPWSMAMNPMQFARHHKILKVELMADRKASWRSQGIPKATLLREPATHVLASQLGPLWTGPENLPPHTKAIYAAFLARTEHDTDACRAYLSKLAKSASKGTMDYSETDILLKKYAKSKAAKLCQSRHAYVLTVMASMLVLARTDGVLASADFLWLKPVDRRLWYTLNCVGRQVAVAEVGGVFAHWIAEKEMGRPLTVPMVEEALKALEKALDNMVYIQGEEEELTFSEPGN